MYPRHILCKKEQARHEKFYEDVLNMLKFFPLISKEYPFIVSNLGDAIKEERKKITCNLTTARLVYKYGIFRESPVLRNSVWLTNWTLTAYHGLSLNCHFILRL